MTDLGNRDIYVGASEAAAAAGLSVWKTNVELWEEKTGRRPRGGHKRVYDRGHDMEPIILTAMEAAGGVQIVRRQAEFVAPERPWLKAHVDGVIDEYKPLPGTPSLHASGPGVVECKAPGSEMFKKYREDGLTNDNIAQLQVGAHCSGFSWGRYGIWDYDEYEPVMFDMLQDSAFLDNLLPRLDHFWDCVVSDRRPEEFREPLPVPVVSGELLDIDGDEITEAAERLLAARQGLKHAEVEDAEALAAVRALVPEDIKKVEIGGVLRCTRSWQAGRVTLQAEPLAAWINQMVGFLHAGDYESATLAAKRFDIRTFQNVGQPFERFLPTPIGEWKGAWKK